MKKMLLMLAANAGLVFLVSLLLLWCHTSLTGVLKKTTTYSQAKSLIHEIRSSQRGIHTHVLEHLASVQNNDAEKAKKSGEQAKADIRALQEGVDALVEMGFSLKINRAMEKAQPDIDAQAALVLRILAMEPPEFALSGSAFVEFKNLQALGERLSIPFEEASQNIDRRADNAGSSASTLLTWLWLPWWLGVLLLWGAAGFLTFVVFRSTRE
jgi:hypothetical protein